MNARIRILCADGVTLHRRRYILTLAVAGACLSDPLPHSALAQSPEQAPPPKSKLLSKSGLPPGRKSPGAVRRWGKLLWNNGESLPGELLEAGDGQVRWKAEAFVEPASVRLSSLKGLEISSRTAPTKEPFRVVMSDGSTLYGDLKGITPEVVTVASERHGNVALRRSEVLEARRLSGGDIVYAGPAGEAGWKVERSDEHDGTFAAGPGGTLMASQWNLTANLAVKIPQQAEIRFRLRSLIRPEFSLGLATSQKERLSIETWDDEIVIHHGAHFTRVAKLAADDRTVDLRLFWDRLAGHCTVLSATGQKLADWEAVAPGRGAHADDSDSSSGAAVDMDPFSLPGRSRTPLTKEGVTLMNKGPELTLELLEIRVWDGEVPAAIVSSGQPTLELAGGTSVAGEVMEATEGLLSFRPADGGEIEEVAMNKIEAVVFTPPPWHPVTHSPSQVWFADGAILNGELEGISEGVCAVRTPISDHLIEAAIDGLNRIVLHPGAAPANEELARLDELTIGFASIHGTLVCNGGAQPRWQLSGGIGSLGISPDLHVRITRAFPPNGAFPKAEGLVYLRDGDVIPAGLRAMDSGEIRIQSDISGTSTLPVSDVRAVQFTGHEVVTKGLGDPGWVTVHGADTAVLRKGDVVELKQGGAFGHPSILQGDEISFSLPASDGNYSTLRLRMFCNGLDMASPSVNVLIGHVGDQVTCGLERDPNQLGVRSEITTGYENPVDVRLVLREREIECFVNGASLQKMAYQSDESPGYGLIFEPAGLWGNAVMPIKVMDFAMKSAPGRCWAPMVNGDAKSKALMVPRFRKEDPPEHALLAANGDLLRGSVEAATSTHFSMRLGMESCRVPRDRVAALVWLSQPITSIAQGENHASGTTANATSEGPKPTPKSALKPSHWLVLASGARLGIRVEKFDETGVSGTHPILGYCRIPLAQIYEVQNYSLRPNAALHVFEDWKLAYAPEPVLPASGGETSPLIGTTAKSFSLPLLGGGIFRLEDARGKVVVLDFWATWCGPCARSMPEMIEAMAPFPMDKVSFIGVNQAEPAPVVRQFLDARGWKLVTALDSLQKAAQIYGVEGIPHTVVIGPDGKIVWVKSGYSAGGAQEVATVVRKILKP